MKKVLYIVWALVLVGVLATTGFFVAKKVFIPKEVHYHAGFVVYENNKKKDFSDFKYMSVKPCGKHQEEVTEADLQDQKAHLHDNEGEVLHTHREGAKWKDLFANIKYALDYSRTTAYSNGQKVENWQNQPITPYQSLVIFIGENDQKYLKDMVKKEYIQQVEKKSENCGTSTDNRLAI